MHSERDAEPAGSRGGGRGWGAKHRLGGLQKRLGSLRAPAGPASAALPGSDLAPPAIACALRHHGGFHCLTSMRPRGRRVPCPHPARPSRGPESEVARQVPIGRSATERPGRLSKAYFRSLFHWSSRVLSKGNSVSADPEINLEQDSHPQGQDGRAV